MVAINGMPGQSLGFKGSGRDDTLDNDEVREVSHNRECSPLSLPSYSPKVRTVQYPHHDDPLALLPPFLPF